MTPVVEPSSLWLYFLLVAGIIALPGMDMAYVAAASLGAGWRGAVRAVSGIVTGGLVHSVVGALGWATLVVLWPAAFNGLLVAGAVYMAWIGLQLWRAGGATTTSGDAEAEDDAANAAPPRALFSRAVLTCLLNPKAYAFMLAVFPGFLPAGDGLWPRVGALASITAATQVAVYGSVAVAVCLAQRRLRWGAGVQQRLMRGVGLLLVVGALVTVTMAWRPLSAGPAPTAAHFGTAA